MVKLFGSTIKETIDAFEGVKFGGEQASASKVDRQKAIMRIIISLLLFGLAVALIFALDGKQDELASTIIGGIIGYWLK